ncbi:RNA 2',3'-cyclic phosphodiesterase [Photobacterium nomapromontoriensis]|uniref:RNA 2',3'-cyclic phosphodiesterase n=1 Tax=Photobacterium nomapromontoriensis TaxID=2910237 RepID=UPI003D0A575F
MKEKKQRLFFALAINKAAPDYPRLCQLVHQWDQFGRAVPYDNLHITLAFIGPASIYHAEKLALAATKLNPPAAFTLTLTTLGYWKRSKILWLGCPAPPRALLTLAHQLSTLTQQCGFAQSAHRFLPHITLAKSIVRRPAFLPDQQLRFHFDHFGLYISKPVNHHGQSGVYYHSLRQWPLGPSHQ